MRRLAVFGFLATVPSWIVLAAVAGNVGLQRSIGSGAWTLLTERPAAGLATVATAGVLGFLAWPLGWAGGRRTSLSALGAAVGWNLVAGLVLAPIAVGELGPLQAPLVVGATTVCGLTLVATWAGASLRSAWQRGS